jgi:hypothetical protein
MGILLMLFGDKDSSYTAFVLKQIGYDFDCFIFINEFISPVALKNAHKGNSLTGCLLVEGPDSFFPPEMNFWKQAEV